MTLPDIDFEWAQGVIAKIAEFVETFSQMIISLINAFKQIPNAADKDYEYKAE